MKESEHETKDIKELKSTIMDLKEENGKLSSKILELENMVSMKDGKISQLEKLVDCYSSELESIPNVSNISKQLESSLKICDELRVDNFHLKQKLADECKKFHDLKE
jgi:regulator of replication initiation timing